MQVVAEHLSVEEVAGLKEAFDMMDTAKRGKINIEELRMGLQKLGQPIPDADLQILMDAVSIFLFLKPNYSSFFQIEKNGKKCPFIQLLGKIGASLIFI